MCDIKYFTKLWNGNSNYNVQFRIIYFSWKDLNCPFRKDPNTHLVFLPTLLRWKSPQRLDGERCSNKDLVEMMFEDED